MMAVWLGSGRPAADRIKDFSPKEKEEQGCSSFSTQYLFPILYLRLGQAFQGFQRCGDLLVGHGIAGELPLHVGVVAGKVQEAVPAPADKDCLLLALFLGLACLVDGQGDGVVGFRGGYISLGARPDEACLVCFQLVVAAGVIRPSSSSRLMSGAVPW